MPGTNCVGDVDVVLAVSGKLDALGGKLEEGNARVLSEVRRQAQEQAKKQEEIMEEMRRMGMPSESVLSEMRRQAQAQMRKQEEMMEEMRRMGMASGSPKSNKVPWGDAVPLWGLGFRCRKQGTHLCAACSMPADPPFVCAPVFNKCTLYVQINGYPVDSSDIESTFQVDAPLRNGRVQAPDLVYAPFTVDEWVNQHGGSHDDSEQVSMPLKSTRGPRPWGRDDAVRRTLWRRACC